MFNNDIGIQDVRNRGRLFIYAKNTEGAVIMQTQTENGLLAKAFLVFMALFSLKTGGFILTIGIRNMQADIYDTLAGVISLDIYGLIFVAIGLAYLHASILPLGERRSWALLFAGLAGGLLYALYAMAALDVAISFYSPLRYSITASFHFIIAVIGGWSLWTRKHGKK